MKQLIKKKAKNKVLLSYDYGIIEKPEEKFLFNEKNYAGMHIIYTEEFTKTVIIIHHAKNITTDKVEDKSILVNMILKETKYSNLIKTILPKIELNNIEKFKSRLEYIIDDVDYEENFNQSLKCFLLFILKNDSLKYPSIGLTNDSRLQCEWKDNKNSLLVLFRENQKIEYAYIKNISTKDEAWSSGFENVNDFWQNIKNNKNYIDLLNE